MTVRLRVLGPVEAWVDGARVDLGHARQQCVLAVLLVEANRVVAVEQVLDRLWQGRPPHRARGALSSYVSRLRRLLTGSGVEIQWRGGGYTLVVDPELVDLHEFRGLVGRAGDEADAARALELLERAARLWRGEAFAGLDTPWIAAVRERLERERFAADTDRADLALRLGRHDALLPELHTRAAAHPLDQRVAGQLLLALHRAGRKADALTHYQDLRARLVEELGADPGPALRELHRRILADDPGLLLPASAPAAPTTPVPRQLPAAPRLFTGRTAELARLDGVLSPARHGGDPPAASGTIVISAIGGAGGIGKTWLAVAWAHRHAAEFPDGQLFVDLRGFSPDSAPMDPAVALRGFLDALDVRPERVPADPHARAALFRSLVADRRVLVVLDNAADTAQVVPLLPGGSRCTVLVTSRHRLPGLVTGHGADQVRLDVLTAEEARALLTRGLGARRVAAERAAVEELVALCGGFPLALGILAARAQTQPDVPLAEFAAELGELGLDALTHDEPAASLPAVLSWSLRDLSAEQRRVFALLGVAPGPDTGLPAVACLADLPAPRARRVLRALEGASLLVRDAHDRYRMHDLIRRYAADTAADLPDAVREAALRRVVDFYLHTASAANRLLDTHNQVVPLDPPEPGVHPHPLPDVAAALAWLDAERTTLLAAQRTAAAHRWHGRVWQLAWSLSTYHFRRGHRHDELTAWRAALDAAAHLPDRTALIRAHRTLGHSCADLGHHEEAVEHLHRALALAEQQRDPAQQGHSHRLLALIWEWRGDDRRALEHARRALDLYRTLDQPVRQARSLNQVGWYAARLGDHDTARAHCREALVLCRRHGDPDGEANTLDSLGYIEHRTGDHRRSVEHYRQALALYRTLGHTAMVAGALDHLGLPHAALGQRDEARAVWGEAARLYRELGRDEDAERVRRQLDEQDGAD